MKLEIELIETNELFYRGREIHCLDTFDSNRNRASITTIRNEVGSQIIFRVQYLNEDKLFTFDLAPISREFLEKILVEKGEASS